MKFIKWIFLLWVVCCVGIAGILLSSRAMPQLLPAYFSHLKICKGKPCFLGIEPGETSWAEAQKMLAPFAPKVDASNTYLYAGGDFGGVSLINNVDTSKVQTVMFGRPDDLMAGTILTQFGVPCFVSLNRDNPAELLLNYPSMQVIVEGYIVPHTRNPNYYFTPASPATVALLPSSDSSRATCGQLTSQSDSSVPWLGFSSWRHYFQVYARSTN